jgi:hypothetical protein
VSSSYSKAAIGDQTLVTLVKPQSGIALRPAKKNSAIPPLAIGYCDLLLAVYLAAINYADDPPNSTPVLDAFDYVAALLMITFC